VRNFLITSIALLVALSVCIWMLAAGFSGTIPWKPVGIADGVMLYCPPAAAIGLIYYYARLWRELAHDWIRGDAEDK
jgi:hypothetical protein